MLEWGGGWDGQDPCSLCHGMCAYTDRGLVDDPTGKSGVSQREGLGGYSHLEERC